MVRKKPRELVPARRLSVSAEQENVEDEDPIAAAQAAKLRKRGKAWLPG